MYLVIPIISIFAGVMTDLKPNILNRSKYNLNPILFITIGAVIFFMTAFRMNVGFDYQNYLKIYNLIKLGEMNLSNTSVEFGYFMLNIFAYRFRHILYVCAFLCIVPKLYVIYKKSENKFFALFFYFTYIFVMYDMGVIRQGIAMTAGFLSLTYIEDRKLIKFLVCILLGALFHITTLFYIPLYFINYKKIKRQNFYFIIVAVFGLSLIDYSEFLVWISEYIPMQRISDKLLYYASTQERVLMIVLLKRIAYVVVFYEFFNFKKINDKFNLICFNGFLLSVIMTGAFTTIAIVGGRAATNLYVLQIFIFTLILTKIDNKYIKYAVYIFFVAGAFRTMFNVIKTGQSTNQPYIPYKWMF